jgi:hypothetical protein
LVGNAAAAGVRGFDPVSFGVADRAGHLDELGIEHSPLIDATIGWILVFHDPDGTRSTLYRARRRPDRPRGYGRPA